MICAKLLTIVCSGSRAAVAGRRMAQPVYPQLRKYPCVPSTYVSCQKPTFLPPARMPRAYGWSFLRMQRRVHLLLVTGLRRRNVARRWKEFPGRAAHALNVAGGSIAIGGIAIG